MNRLGMRPASPMQADARTSNSPEFIPRIRFFLLGGQLIGRLVSCGVLGYTSLDG